MTGSHYRGALNEWCFYEFVKGFLQAVIGWFCTSFADSGGGGVRAWQNQLEAEGKSKDESLRDGSSTQGEHTL